MFDKFFTFSKNISGHIWNGDRLWFVFLIVPDLSDECGLSCDLLFELDFGSILDNDFDNRMFFWHLFINQIILGSACVYPQHTQSKFSTHQKQEWPLLRWFDLLALRCFLSWVFWSFQSKGDIGVLEPVSMRLLQFLRFSQLALRYTSLFQVPSFLATRNQELRGQLAFLPSECRIQYSLGLLGMTWFS